MARQLVENFSELELSFVRASLLKPARVPRQIAKSTSTFKTKTRYGQRQQRSQKRSQKTEEGKAEAAPNPPGSLTPARPSDAGRKPFSAAPHETAHLCRDECFRRARLVDWRTLRTDDRRRREWHRQHRRRLCGVGRGEAIAGMIAV